MTISIKLNKYYAIRDSKLGTIQNLKKLRKFEVREYLHYFEDFFIFLIGMRYRRYCTRLSVLFICARPYTLRKYFRGVHEVGVKGHLEVSLDHC